MGLVLKTTIYMIRHGECAGNKENRIRGRMDFPLNENGIIQAKALAAALKDKGITKVYTGPLKRASKTAEILCDVLDVPLEVSEGFNNISIGVWENRIKAELMAEEPDRWNTWLNRPEELVIEGGETIDMVRLRATEALKRIVSEHAGETLAIVGHRGTLKPLLCGALGIVSPYYWRLHFDTASYSILTYDEVQGYCLVGLNYTEHLKGISIVQEFD